MKNNARSGAAAATKAAAPALPKGKQTTLGLYVTSREAYEMWKADPKKVKVLDVRTPEEYIFVGHAEMATNIPLAYMKRGWDLEINEPNSEPNPDFAPMVKSLFKPTDAIFVTCRSGVRSAMAVNVLAKLGYTNVYNITDGFEGDTVKDPASVFNGKRMLNGWKNSAPWTFDVVPELLYPTT